PMDLSPYAPERQVEVSGVSLWDLVDAYRRLLARLPKEDRVAEVRIDAVSVEEMMDWILGRLRRTGACLFSDLMGLARSRSELVSGFLALLELVKEQRVVCHQYGPFEDIEIRLKGEAQAC
ncbi:MAG: segregation/condensation protein A, partial [Alicyclobacillus sp.]|nr:segregation/condensation protein A [Alicyclobacillus sp.]